MKKLIKKDIDILKWPDEPIIVATAVVQLLLQLTTETEESGGC